SPSLSKKNTHTHTHTRTHTHTLAFDPSPAYQGLFFLPLFDSSFFATMVDHNHDKQHTRTAAIRQRIQYYARFCFRRDLKEALFILTTLTLYYLLATHIHYFVAHDASPSFLPASSSSSSSSYSRSGAAASKSESSSSTNPLLLLFNRPHQHQQQQQ
ncbi:MAG: hypothetical protein J3R72DRAFT_147590, partial [Linnemannia gamsii]